MLYCELDCYDYMTTIISELMEKWEEGEVDQDHP